MTLISDTIKSKAMVLYDPTLPHIAIDAYLKSVINEVVQRSLENAKYAVKYFPQLLSNFTSLNLDRITNVSLSPPKALKTDSRIEVEIFAAPPSDHKPPILIFSHGLGVHPIRYRPLLRELASQGYTVLSLTHLSSVDGIPDFPLKEENELAEKLAVVMTNNIQYVLSEVRSGVLKNVGDPNTIILGGHSLGGAASIIVSRTDPSVSGCVNLDGFLKGNAKTDGLTQPLLMIIGDYQEGISELEQHPKEELREYAKYSRESLEEYETLRRNSPHSEKILIQEATHMDFTDLRFRNDLAGEKVRSTAMRVHTIASSEMLKFLRSLK